MATSNFYESGNHGLNVIHDEDELGDFQVYDVLATIVEELNIKQYSVTDVKNWVSTPRSYETGIQYAIHAPNNRLVALLEVCTGYYSGANVNIYTGLDLIDLLDVEDEPVTVNKRYIEGVVKAVKRNTAQYVRTATFSNGESVYESVQN